MEIRGDKHRPWNRGQLVGQKHPLTPQQIWTIRMWLEASGRPRDLALFNTALDSKLRGCDLLRLKVSDVLASGLIKTRATIRQRKTSRPVQFEITPKTQDSLETLIRTAGLTGQDYLFGSRMRSSAYLSTRQYSRIVKQWIAGIGVDPTSFGTHSLRRTKATLLYRQTKNLRAIQLLLGHSKLDSTVRYLGIEIDDALELSEQLDI